MAFTTRAERAQHLLDRIAGVTRGRPCGSCGRATTAGDITASIRIDLRSVDVPVCTTCAGDLRLVDTWAVPSYSMPATDPSTRASGLVTHPARTGQEVQLEPLWRCTVILGLAEPDHALAAVLRGSGEHGPTWAGNTVAAHAPGYDPNRETTITERFAFVDTAGLSRAYIRAANPPKVLGSPDGLGCLLCGRTQGPRGLEWVKDSLSGRHIDAACWNASRSAENYRGKWTPLAWRLADWLAPAVEAGSEILDWPGVHPPSNYAGSPEPFGWIDRHALIAGIQAEHLQAERAKPHRRSVAAAIR